MRISWIVAVLVTAIAIAVTHAKPTIYKRNEDNVFEPGEFLRFFMRMRFRETFQRFRDFSFKISRSKRGGLENIPQHLQHPKLLKCLSLSPRPRAEYFPNISEISTVFAREQGII